MKLSDLRARFRAAPEDNSEILETKPMMIVHGVDPASGPDWTVVRPLWRDEQKEFDIHNARLDFRREYMGEFITDDTVDSSRFAHMMAMPHADPTITKPRCRDLPVEKDWLPPLAFAKRTPKF